MLYSGRSIIFGSVPVFFVFEDFAIDLGPWAGWARCPRAPRFASLVSSPAPPPPSGAREAGRLTEVVGALCSLQPGLRTAALPTPGELADRTGRAQRGICWSRAGM